MDVSPLTQQATPPSSESGIRAPKACVPCAVAKIKCETDSGQLICKRCLRLKKACRAQPAGAQRRKPKQKTDVSRIEKKLDGVAAILAASETLSASRSQPGQPPLSVDECVTEFIKNDDEAQAMLDIYRDEMMPHFPFVLIPNEMTLYDLRTRKPFLLLTILMVACRHDLVRQSAIAKTVRTLISQRIISSNEPSLSFLQGMLIFLAWYHLHLHLGAQLTNYVHLMMAIAIDLGLNRQIVPRKYAKPQKDYFQTNGREDGGVPRTLEESRTFMGTYALTVIISNTARDFEPLRYSRYADDCCQLLSRSTESDTDASAAQLVKILCVADRIKRALQCDDWDPNATMSAPLAARIKLLEAELQAVKPGGFSNNVPLVMQYHMVETFLFEIALDDNIKSSSYGSYSITRLDLLFACLEAAKRFFEVFHQLTACQYLDLPYSAWTNVGHMYVVLSKLSLCQWPGWDQSYVTKTLNFHDVLEALSRRVDEATEFANQTTAISSGLARSVPIIFTSIRGKIADIRVTHEARRSDQIRRAQQQADGIANQPGQNEILEPNSGFLPEDFVMPDSLSFFEFDEPFWTQNWV